MTGQAEAGRAATSRAEASEAGHPVPAQSAMGSAFSVAVAALALAAGAGLVGAGVAWVPPRGSTEGISQGARLYATECASCHGTRLEGQAMPTRSEVRRAWTAPPLSGTGHAWRHSDAELATIMARGTEEVARLDGTPGMPAFAERLGPGEIGAILTYLKSRWPANVRAYRAALNVDGGVALATLVRDPDWTFPSQCLLPAGRDR